MSAELTIVVIRASGMAVVEALGMIPSLLNNGDTLPASLGATEGNEPGDGDEAGDDEQETADDAGSEADSSRSAVHQAARTPAQCLVFNAAALQRPWMQVVSSLRRSRNLCVQGVG